MDALPLRSSRRSASRRVAEAGIISADLNGSDAFIAQFSVEYADSSSGTVLFGIRLSMGQGLGADLGWRRAADDGEAALSSVRHNGGGRRFSAAAEVRKESEHADGDLRAFRAPGQVPSQDYEAMTRQLAQRPLFARALAMYSSCAGREDSEREGGRYRKVSGRMEKTVAYLNGFEDRLLCVLDGRLCQSLPEEPAK